MKKTIAMYLAGGIKKDHEKNGFFWTDKEISYLKKALSDYEVFFLNPAFRTDDLSDERAVFGRDMTQVFSSNLVFVDARDRRGLGVGAEMMWAKVNNIPVISWAPRNTHYHKDEATLLDVPVKNYIHPFVESLSDKIVEDLEEGSKWIHELISNPSTAIKGIKDIKDTMQYYQKSQLHRDEPMKKMLLASKELESRMHRMSPI